MLFDNLLNKDNIENAWLRINKDNETSYGISEETLSQFSKNLVAKLDSIHDDLKAKRYQFAPYRAVAIPKKEKGKYRPLRIPDIRDRVVLKAIATIVEENLTDYFKPVEGISFAFQKKLGVKSAIEKIIEHYQNGFHFVFETDIQSFFNEVNRKILLDNLFRELPDDSLRPLLSESLMVGVAGLEKLKNDEQRNLFKSDRDDVGIPQGSAISPLLANFYLRPFDVFMTSKDFKIVRYADDFVVMCKNKEDAISAYTVSKQFLEEELKLSIYPLDSTTSKASRIHDLSISKDFSFLSIAFDGKSIYPSKDSVKRLMERFDEICHSKDRTAWSILNQLRFSLDGWLSTYSYTDVDRYIDQIDSSINRKVLLGLSGLDWKFTNKSKGKIKSKYKEHSASSDEALSHKQRSKSGIDFCQDILKQRRKSSTNQSGSSSTSQQ